MDEQSQTTPRHFGLSRNVPPTPAPTSMPPLRPQNPECLFPDQPCNTMYHLPTCWNCSLLMMLFQIVRLQVAPDDGSRRSSDGTEEEPPMHLRGALGPAPRSPRSRDGRASSAAQRSRSPRRTRRGGPRSDAATQTPLDIPAASSGAAASGAEVVRLVPSNFRREPQPYIMGDLERHDINIGGVPDQDMLDGSFGEYVLLEDAQGAESDNIGHVGAHARGYGQRRRDGPNARLRRRDGQR